MSRHVFTVVLLAILGAVSLAFIMRPKVAHAQGSSCAIPKSAGTYRGGVSAGVIMIFENANGTLSLYTDECKLYRTLTRN